MNDSNNTPQPKKSFWAKLFGGKDTNTATPPSQPTAVPPIDPSGAVSDQSALPVTPPQSELSSDTPSTPIVAPVQDAAPFAATDTLPAEPVQPVADAFAPAAPVIDNTDPNAQAVEPVTPTSAAESPATNDFSPENTTVVPVDGFSTEPATPLGSVEANPAVPAEEVQSDTQAFGAQPVTPSSDAPYTPEVQPDTQVQDQVSPQFPTEPVQPEQDPTAAQQ